MLKFIFIIICLLFLAVKYCPDKIEILNDFLNGDVNVLSSEEINNAPVFSPEEFAKILFNTNKIRTEEEIQKNFKDKFFRFKGMVGSVYTMDFTGQNVVLLISLPAIHCIVKKSEKNRLHDLNMSDEIVIHGKFSDITDQGIIAKDCTILSVKSNNM